MKKTCINALKIENNVQDVYYVDLSLDYKNSSDGWMTLDTGIYDTFESGSFDSNWGSLVSSNCTITTMYNQKVAVDSDATQSPIFALTNPIGGDIDLSFSFVRTSRTEKPEFRLVAYGTSTTIFKVVWDYELSIINVSSEEKTYKFKYNTTPLGYVNDLRCSNSLRELNIRITGNTSESEWTFSYKLKDDWIDTTIEGDDYTFGTDDKVHPVWNVTQNVGYGFMKLLGSL